MKSFYCFQQDLSRKHKELKRGEKKSLPHISQKQVPLHNNTCQKLYKKPFQKGLSLDRWAYVSNSRKKDLTMTKYIHQFDQFRTHPTSLCLNPENDANIASLTLLQNYFKRKKMSKLRETIKIPLHLAQEGVSSVGFQGVNLQNSRNRNTIDYLYNPSEGDHNNVENSQLPQKRNYLKQKFRRNKSRLKEEMKKHSIDFYFKDIDRDESP